MLIILLVIPYFNVNLVNAAVDESEKGTLTTSDRLLEKANGDLEQFIPEEHYDDWELVWNDEFDQSGDDLNDYGVNLDNWGFQNGTGTEYGLTDWGNNEQQYYQEQNATVQDGKLVIEAKKETVEGKPYTSTRLFTKDKFSQKYGKFEARMKLPLGNGLWPAFWLLPETDIYNGWAASGEIDIMEARGRIPNEIGGAIHYGGNWPNNKYSGGTYYFEEGTSISDFHVYSVEWEPGEIRWYVDGELFHTETNWYGQSNGQPAKYAFPAPFDQEFYILLNLAVGGHFDGGLIPEDSDLPAKMEVDYVRVYELTGREYKEPIEPIVEKEDLPAGAKQPTEDGNLIYDSKYELGFKEIVNDSDSLNSEKWNFAHINSFNGNGTIAVEDVGGTKFARIDISEPGTEQHSLQLIQELTLGKGRYYKVSFDAKASGNRNINVKASGGESRGWTTYSSNETIALTEQVESYDFTFQMEAESDILARLEFNMGINSQSVWIGNVRVEEVEVEDPYNESLPKEPLGDGNHIYNGTFDLGRMDRMTYWDFSTDNADATASVDPDERKLNILINDGGSTSDAILLSQKGINLLKDNDYKIVFEATAENARDIQLKITSKDGSAVFMDKVVRLTEFMEEHTVTFTVDKTDVDGEFVILLGGDNADVTLDNISIFRTTNNVDYSGVDIFPLENGDFSSDLEHWENYITDGAQASISASEGYAITSISNTGNVPWSIQLVQSGMSFSKGIDYVLSFDAKSTKERTIEAVLENASYQRYVSQTVDLSTDFKNYRFEFKMPANDLADLKFLLGKINGSETLGAHDVVIDNVVLEVKDPPFKRPAKVNADVTNNVVGQPIELSFDDHLEWRENITAITLDDQVLTTEDYTVEANRIILAASLFMKPKIYTIVIESEGYAPVTIQQNIGATEWREIGENLIVNGDFEIPIVDFNTDEHWKIHNQGVYEQWAGLAEFSVNEGELHVNVHQEGWEWWHIQLFQEQEVPAGIYKLSFDARSTHQRPINVEIAGSSIESFTIQESLQNYQTIIQVGTDGVKKILFGLGKATGAPELVVPYEIVMDNIRLVEVEAVVEGETPDPGTEEPGEETEVPDPDTEEPGSDTGSDQPGDGKTPEKPEPGKELPKTSLPYGNNILFGGILLMLAAILVVFRKVAYTR